jgi:hypothetical protein
MARWQQAPVTRKSEAPTSSPRWASAPLTAPEQALDYDKPIEQLRADIGGLPEDAKRRAYDIWADRQIAKERERAGSLAELPSPQRGIPIIGGLLDEAAAGIKAGMHAVTGGRIGHPYDEGLALERSRMRQAEEASPGLAVGGQVAAGIATGGPLLGRLAPARTLAGRVGQGVVVSVPLGNAERFTRGEGSFADRAENAVSGTGMDVALGTAIPVAGAAITRGLGAAQQYLGPAVTRLRHGPEEAADEILANRIAREGSSPAQKRLDLQTGQQIARLNSNSRATLPEAIADTSDDMQRLTGSLYRQGGEAGNLVKQELTRRQRGPENPYAERPLGPPDGQHARIMDATERALLVRTSDTARRTERQIMADQAREGRRLYEAAYEASDDFDLSPATTAMGLVIQQYPGPVAARLERARRLFLRPGSPGNQPMWVDNVRRFDAAKKSLDDMIETAQRGGQNNLARELTQFKDGLLRQVHGTDAAGNATRNLPYQQARQTWGTAAENREAIELGRGALREGSEISVEQFREITRGQQQLFRLGFLESLRNALGTKRPGNDVTQLFQQQRVRELMGEIVPRSQGRGDVFRNRPERYGDLQRREGRMVQTNNAAMGNSATAQRQMDDMSFTGDALAGMWNRFRSSPSLFNMGVEAIGVGIQKVFGYRQDVALALARRLLETDPTARNQILRRLQRRGGPDRFARFADTVDRAGNTMIGATQPALIEDGRGGAR